ncbi:TonB-dependent receptor [Brevundimonas sp.]|jgi:iron complex outermembrane receptor protein|uniref:TonB-dependent receptor n=1 Tax=Brevundimonas sp. TaxID=1871086 RepID=UPI0037C01726
MQFKMMCGTAIAVVMACAWQPAQAQVRSFDVPEQSASTGVLAFGRQAGLQIVAPAADLAGKRTRAVKGEMSVDAALARLIDGVGLQVVARNGAIVSLAAARPAAANETADIGDVVVTGSRLGQSARDAATPVAVVSAEEIRQSGALNIEELFNDSPQFVPSTNGGAYGNVVPGGAADANLRGFGATRNLVLVNGRRFTLSGAEQVTDLNTIPSTLIRRTEIVTGGSSAVYGSDAITGVINFVMRDDFDGVELNAQVNVDSPTTTPTYNLDLTAGRNFAGGRGNITLAANYLDRGAVTRAMRGDFAPQWLVNGCVTPETHDPRGAGTPVTVPGNQTCREAGGVPGLVASGSGDIPNGRFTGVPTVGSSGSNAGLDAALVAAGLGGLGSRGFTFDDAGASARPALNPEDNYNLQPPNYLILPQKRWMLNGFGHYAVNDRTTAYAELHFSRNEVDVQIAPASIGGTALFDVNNPYLSPAMQEVLRQLDLKETATTATNRPGDGLASLTYARRLEEVGPRINRGRRDVARVLGGVRGELGDVSTSYLRNLSYDAYYSYARTEQVDTQHGNISRSRFNAGLRSQNGQAPLINIFGQNMSDEAVAAIIGDATNRTESSLHVASAVLKGDLFDLPAGTVPFSLGVEWRRSEVEYTPDDFLASGDAVGFPATLPTQGEVSAREIFGEVKLPILADLPMVQRLGLNAAFRYSDYDLEGVGGVWTYLGGAEWRLNDDLALRGQYQRAVRAPNVGELFGGLRQSGEAAVDPCGPQQPVAGRTATVRALCVASGVPADVVFTDVVQPNNTVTAVYGGNPDVGVEQSDTYTFGAVFTPSAVPNLFLSADYFDITLDGAIAALGGGLNNTLNLCYNVVQDLGSEFCRAVTRNPTTGEIGNGYSAQVLMANTGALETSGVDLAGRYGLDLPFGLPGQGRSSRLSLSSNWTWTQDLTTTPVAAMPNIRNECAGAYGNTCGEPIPKWRGVTRLTWSDGPLDLSLRARYIGAVTVDTYLLPVRSGAAAPAMADLVNPRIGSQTYFDLSFAYQTPNGMRLYGGMNNLLDRDPPIVANPRANTYPTTYDAMGMGFFLGVTAAF